MLGSVYWSANDKVPLHCLFLMLILVPVFSTEKSIGLFEQARGNWTENIKCDVDLWEGTLSDPGAYPWVFMMHQ